MPPSEYDMKIIRKISDSVILTELQLFDHLIVIPRGKDYIMADEGII